MYGLWSFFHNKYIISLLSPIFHVDMTFEHEFIYLSTPQKV